MEDSLLYLGSQALQPGAEGDRIVRWIMKPFVAFVQALEVPDEPLPNFIQGRTGGSPAALIHDRLQQRLWPGGSFGVCAQWRYRLRHDA